MGQDTEGTELEVDIDELRALVLVGEIDEAVELYELAPPGTWEKLLERLEDAPDEAMRNAAMVFDRARDFTRAAETFKGAGDVEAAGSSYESGGDYNHAAETYNDAGDLLRAAWALARAGHPFEAAETFREADDKVNEVLMLKQVPDTDADYDAAQARLLELEPKKPPARGIEPERAVAFRALKNLPMFAELPLDDMRALFEECEEKRFYDGEYLLHRGQPATGLFVLADGKAVVTQADRELNELGPGAHIGEMGLLREASVSADVIARGDVVALFIARAPFERFLASRPDAARRLYKLFAMVLADIVAELSKRADG